MKGYVESWKLFKYNFSSIVLFEIIYKLLSMAVLAPLLYAILNFSVAAANIKYLSTGTMTKYFRAPSTYALIFVILIVISIYILINISGLIYAIEASHRREKTNPLALLFKGVANAVRVINPKNMGVMIYVLFILPFTYTTMISGSLVGIKMPEFFSRFLKQNRFYVVIALVLYLILCVISMFRIFSLNYYSIYKIDYKQATKLSKKTIRHHSLGVFFGIVFWNIIITMVLFLLEGTLATAIAGVLAKVVAYKKLNFIFNIAIRVLFLVLYLISSVISTPLIISYICKCFYRLEENIDYKEYQKVRERRNAAGKKTLSPQHIKRKNRLVFWFMIILGIALNGTYIYLSINNKVSLKIAYPTRANVTAHRGDSENAPENTMAAFRLAVENQADVIELDVRQTKDGHYIVMHDENLYRTTGVDSKVGEVDFEFIKKLDAGSKFSDEYKGEPVPSLEEVLQFAKDEDVFLNIELKPANTDNNYEQGIVAMLEEYEMIDSCVVGSSDYTTLKNVKKFNPDVQTIYIMSMAFGEFGDMEYVDGFSIRHNFISNNIVQNIHKNGKEIYAWTVNNESDIKELLLMDVDNVISDDPYKTKDIIFNANDSLLTDWLQRLIDEY